jgi:voltage-gated potassium channel
MTGNQTSNHSAADHVTFFDVVVLVLSILVLIGMLADTVTKLPAEASTVLEDFDLFVCIVLFIDFLRRFHSAPKKLTFLKWGWIDLIACIPNINAFRWGRMIRILRVIRILRAFRSFQRVLSIVFHHRTRNGIVSAIVITILLVAFSSIAILVTETSPRSNIKTAEDAVWWSVSTITTVGYGDRYPVTTPGRAVAVVLMFCGVGLFGTLSGIVAMWFLGDRQNNRNTEILIQEIRILQEKVDHFQSSQNVEARTDRPMAFPNEE